MDWKQIAKKLGGAGLGLLGNAIAPGIGGPVVAMIGEALGLETEATPEAIDKRLNDPDAVVKLRELQSRERTRLAELASAERLAEIDERKAALAEINRTARAEAGTDDKFVRRWRPTMGYVVTAAFGWVTFCIGLLIVVSGFRDVSQSVTTLQALSGPLMTLFGIGLSVLGVSVRERSKDKQVAAGMQPRGLLDVIRGKS